MAEKCINYLTIIRSIDCVGTYTFMGLCKRYNINNSEFNGLYHAIMPLQKFIKGGYVYNFPAFIGYIEKQSQLKENMFIGDDGSNRFLDGNITVYIYCDPGYLIMFNDAMIDKENMMMLPTLNSNNPVKNLNGMIPTWVAEIFDKYNINGDVPVPKLDIVSPYIKIQSRSDSIMFNDEVSEKTNMKFDAAHIKAIFDEADMIDGEVLIHAHGKYYVNTSDAIFVHEKNRDIIMSNNKIGSMNITMEVTKPPLPTIPELTFDDFRRIMNSHEKITSDSSHIYAIAVNSYNFLVYKSYMNGYGIFIKINDTLPPFQICDIIYEDDEDRISIICCQKTSQYGINDNMFDKDLISGAFINGYYELMLQLINHIYENEKVKLNYKEGE